MRTYVWTTGTLFALLAVVHLWRTIAEWPGSTPGVEYIVHAAIGVVTAALAVWAWRLLRRSGGV
jgi:hypothetical protein